MQTSVKLLIIAVLLLGLGLANLWLFSGGIKSIERDAAEINRLGMIRGSIQRIAKMELAGIHEPGFVQQTDALVFGLEHVLPSLKEDWTEMKAALQALHNNPGAQTRARFLEASERCWVSTNETVFAAQYASETKMGSFERFGWMMAANIVLIVLILGGVRSLVKKRVEYRASHDPLTGALNRSELARALQELIATGRAACLMIDIDHFKKVNDTYGHAAGDRALRAVAGLIETHIRKGDFLVRYGGEEFTLLAAQLDHGAARHLAERIRAAIEAHPFGEPERLTVSIGVATLKPGDTAQTLIDRADGHLYAAKEAGRNRVAG